jgi:sec-independent protein translocase protein TatC
VGYGLRGVIIAELQHPLGQQLFYTSPMGSFDFIMRICLLVGFLIALPVFCYNLLRFIEPALPGALSLWAVLAIIACSYALAVAGVAFAYFVCLPAALHFFGTVGTSNVHPLISIDRYASFVFGYFAMFALIFQLPLLLLLINGITPLGPRGLRAWRKWVIVSAFAVALVAPSAPDPLSQVILAVPIIVLYEASIWLVWLANRRRGRMAPGGSSEPAPTQVVVGSPTPVAAPVVAQAARPVGMIDLYGGRGRPRPKPTLNVLDLRSPGS